MVLLPTVQSIDHIKYPVSQWTEKDNQEMEDYGYNRALHFRNLCSGNIFVGFVKPAICFFVFCSLWEFENVCIYLVLAFISAN